MKCPICDYPYATYKDCPNCKREDGKFIMSKKAAASMDSGIGILFIIFLFICLLLYMCGKQDENDERIEHDKQFKKEFGNSN